MSKLKKKKKLLAFPFIYSSDVKNCSAPDVANPGYCFIMGNLSSHASEMLEWTNLIMAFDSTHSAAENKIKLDVIPL